MPQRHRRSCAAGDNRILFKSEGSGKRLAFHQPILHISNFIKPSPRIGENTVILLLF
jgi:hypothetical protein